MVLLQRTLRLCVTCTGISKAATRINLSVSAVQSSYWKHVLTSLALAVRAGAKISRAQGSDKQISKRRTRRMIKRNKIGTK